MRLKMLCILPAVCLAAALTVHAAEKPKTAPPAPTATDPYAEVQPATETLDLGINMTARTEVVERFAKFRGSDTSALTSGEYQQLTGRAGRRGDVLQAVNAPGAEQEI